jgi:hypothetical protein
MAQAPIFVSYSRHDGEFALQLGHDLRAAGVNLWIDQLDIPLGGRWDRAVEQALRACRMLIVILSPEVVASENVMDEVGYALKEYFSAQPWYRPMHAPDEFPTSLLSAVQKPNIELIHRDQQQLAQ